MKFFIFFKYYINLLKKYVKYRNSNLLLLLKSNFYAIIMLLKGDLYMETTKFIRNVQEQNKENYFHNKKNQTVELIKLNGSIELAPIVGLSEVICDIVQTGTTLKENGLVVLEEVCPISARMVVNKVSMKINDARIKNLILRMREAL